MSLTTSCFEDLSNELYLEIFQYLNGFAVYCAFEGLNSRFQVLHKNYSYSFNCTKPIHLPYLYVKILSDITPKAICSLKINVTVKHLQELFLTKYNIQQFINLEQLQMEIHSTGTTINSIHILEELLERFSAFPKLSRLKISLLFIIGDKNKVKKISEMLFNLSPLKLKHLTLTFSLNDKCPLFNDFYGDRSTLIDDIDYQRLNRASFVMIEYLTIFDFFDINDLKYIFIQMPKLKYLNLNMFDKNNFEMHRDPYYDQLQHIKPYNLNNLELFIPLNLKTLDLAVDISIDYKDLIEFFFQPIQTAQIKLKKLILQIHLYDSVNQQMVQQLIQTTLSTKITMVVKPVYSLTRVPRDEYMGMQYYADRNLGKEITQFTSK